MGGPGSKRASASGGSIAPAVGGAGGLRDAAVNRGPRALANRTNFRMERRRTPAATQRSLLDRRRPAAPVRPSTCTDYPARFVPHAGPRFPSVAESVRRFASSRRWRGVPRMLASRAHVRGCSSGPTGSRCDGARNATKGCRVRPGRHSSSGWTAPQAGCNGAPVHLRARLTARRRFPDNAACERGA